MKQLLSIPSLLSVFFFNHERVLAFVKCFFCVKWDDHGFFFPSMNVVHCNFWFPHGEPRLHSCNISHLVRVYIYIYLVCCWNNFVLLLLRVFAFKLILAQSFVFLWCYCLPLVSAYYWLHEMSFKKCPFLFYSFESDGERFLLIVNVC